MTVLSLIIVFWEYALLGFAFHILYDMYELSVKLKKEKKAGRDYMRDRLPESPELLESPRLMLPRR